MIIFFWLLTISLFLLTTSILLFVLFSDDKSKNIAQTFMNGLKDGLRGCGFHVKQPSYPIELYKCIIMSDGHICDDCLDKTTWPPMDIADWMKAGLPNTPTDENNCHGHCHVELVLYKTVHQIHPDH